MSTILNGNLIYTVSDITAGLFLIVLIVAVAFYSEKHRGLSHLLASVLFIMATVFTRTSARMMEVIINSPGWHAGINLAAPALVTTLWIIAYIFTSLGITESVAHVIYINEGKSKSSLRTLYFTCVVFIAAGTALFCLFKVINILIVMIIALFGYYLQFLRRNHSEWTWREFMRASAFAVTTFVIALAFNQLRLTGLGLSIMLMIMVEQYHNHVRQELAEKEAALAKSRVQLLADQISPHYIYNSLQSISGMCADDPARAGEAIDVFAAYLRGNLESLTEEDLIPFARELEYTQAYLELETLSGSRHFVVEYDLGVTDFMLPPLVLQPVVENAVKHGTARAAIGHEPESNAVTHITIATSELGGSVRIEVTDRMEGCESTAVLEPANNFAKKKSVGLDNVRTRLDIQCSGKLEMESIENGTKVTMLLPKTQIVTTQ